MEKQDDNLFDPVTQSLAPSHILQDGRFIFLPPPTERDRIRFFERAIARHGLLQGDLDRRSKKDKDEDGEAKKDSDAETLKVHPLALASARLQSDGINELNRAINLNSLVSTGEYFSLSNIVDPSLEIPAPEKSTNAAKTENSTAATSTSTTATATTKPQQQQLDVQEEQRTKASFVLKRKRVQFEKSATTLQRHRRRLAAAVVAQQQPDQRLRQLRQKWRLVAPEHGTRAAPHATRPTEVIACDVDVYSNYSTSSSNRNSAMGRLASLVPRYATMELKSDYRVDADLAVWEKEYMRKDNEQGDEDAMEVDVKEEADGENGKDASSNGKEDDDIVWTRAEPFAIADPALGKLDADFDPTKVAMLTLQFDIEKPSTGFCQSARLEPISTVTEEKESKYPEDEKVLVALQHSLFCAKLFESIRRELAPDTEQVGQVRAQTTTTSKSVWLSGESEENFLPPPSQMRGEGKDGLAALCVVHCHEGEVKVQLDCEYTLRVKLVEAGSSAASTGGQHRATTDASAKSGSQSPSQLLLLCRTLLLHSQEAYHKHSMQEEKRQREAAESADKTKQVHAMRKDESLTSPHILQSVVSLGSKILLERRVRKALNRVNQWLVHTSKSDNGDGEVGLQVDWLSLSVFDFYAQFAVSFRSWSVDVHLTGDELTVTRFTNDGHYRKAKLHSEHELELHLRMALQRVLRSNKK